MYLKQNKKGLTSGIVQTAFLAIVLVVVLLQVYANITPTAQAAGNELGNEARCEASGGSFDVNDRCSSNGSIEGTQIQFRSIPLSGLFSGTGVVFIIIIAPLIILIVRSFLTSR